MKTVTKQSIKATLIRLMHLFESKEEAQEHLQYTSALPFANAEQIARDAFEEAYGVPPEY